MLNYKHQTEILDKSIKEPHWALLMDPGTGKTRIAIATSEWWHINKQVNCIVVICPKSIIGTWASLELPKHSTVPFQVFKWDSSFNITMKNEFIACIKNPALLYILINPDALIGQKIEPVFSVIDKSRTTGWIVDESTAIKNMKAQRTKRAIEYSQKAKFKRIMSGTPIVQSPLDVYSQTEFLSPGLLGFKSYYSMKTRYCEMKRKTFGFRSFDEVIGYRDLDDLRRRLNVFSSFVKLEDCVDLPEQVFKEVVIDLTLEQKAAYEELKTKAILWLQDHEITAVNALSLLVKLHQIAVGQLKTPDGSYISLKNNRITALKEILEETPNKVLVWSTYVNSTKDLLKELGANAIGITSDMNPVERQNAIEAWRKGAAQALVLNPQSASHGLTLNEAKTAIFYSNSFNLEHRLQALRRNYRIGQDSRTLVIDLIAPETVETKIMTALNKKEELANLVSSKEALLDILQ